MHQQHANNNKQNSTQRHQARSEEQLHESVEVDTVEELLQYDQEQTELPRVIRERLSESVPKEQTKHSSWWSRLFRKTGHSDIE